MHLYNRESTGKKAWHRAFKPDMLNDCRIMVVNVRDEQMGHLWQLGLLHLQRGGSTIKKDLNRTFEPDTINSCRIMEVYVRTKTMVDLWHLRSL